MILGGLLLAASATSCSNCQGGSKASAILDHVPNDSAFVLTVPALEDALNGTVSLINQFRNQPPINMLLTQKKAEMVKELGFDPEKPETLKTKGIDPKGGLAVSLDPTGEQLAIVFKTSDAKALETYLRETAKKAVGADVQFKETKEGALKVTQLQQQGKDEVLAAWTETGDVAIFCPMAPKGKHGACLQRMVKPAKAIKDNPEFKKLLERVGDHQLAAFFSTDSLKTALGQELDKQLAEATSPWKKEFLQDKKKAQDEVLSDVEGGAFGLQLSAKGIQAKAFALLSKKALDEVRAVAKGAGNDTELTKLIDPDALVVLRFSLVASKLVDRVRKEMGKQEPDAEKQIKEELDQVSELSASLAGRYAIAIYPPDASALKDALSGGVMSALSAVTAQLAAQVQDQAKAEASLKKLESTLQKMDVPVKTSKEGARTFYSIDTPDKGPMASWTLGDKVLLAGSDARIKKALKRAGSGDSILSSVKSPLAKRMLEGKDTLALYIGVGKIIDWLRSAELPPETKMIVNSAIMPLSKVKELVVGGEIDDDGLAGELQLLVGD